ncbi:MAG: endolytic transglycosylase MltG [Atopobiaceae bacterium]|nr:endolytic transglycosylase MltG [Atopobiaceae bacterium]
MPQHSTTGRSGSHFSAPATGAKAPAQRTSAQRAKAPSTHSAPRAQRPSTQRPQQPRRTSKRAASSGQVSDRTASITMNAKPRTSAQRAAARRGTPSKGKAPFVAGLVAVVAVIVGLVVFVVLPRFHATSAESTIAAGEQVEVDIPEGSGGSAIAKQLKDAGVISSSDDFYKEVQKQNADQKLKSGAYTFVTGADVSEVVKQLIEGPNATGSKLTVAEGLTVTQTAAVAESSLGIAQSDFLAQAKASNYVADYPFLSGVANDSLEGFLYPKTYYLSGKAINADTAIRAMLDQYKSEVAGLDFSGSEEKIKSAYGLTMSDYQILTLASIVEKEATTDDDRPKVASVFYNRLSNSQAYLHYLQSDATLTYALGHAPSADELHSDTSPYNTYLTAGLTPTPICSSSLASIKAALAPSDTKYLYFWITDTSHVFSETYDEHLQAISDAKQSQ